MRWNPNMDNLELEKKCARNLPCQNTTNKSLKEIRVTLHIKCRKLFTQFPSCIAYPATKIRYKNIEQPILTTPNQSTMRKPASTELYCTYNPNQDSLQYMLQKIIVPYHFLQNNRIRVPWQQHRKQKETPLIHKHSMTATVDGNTQWQEENQPKL